MLKKVFIALSLLLCLSNYNDVRAQSPVPMKYKVIVADEGNGKVHYINLANPTERWSVTTANRDLQLIGSDRLMVSVGDGYAEYNVKTGTFLKKVTIGSGVQSVFRLSEKSTFIGSDGSPVSVKEIDSTGKQIRKINFALNASIRIVRPTTKGTYLVGGKVAGTMYECDSTGAVKWEANAGGEPYMALRLPNGNTLISNGYGGQMVLVGKDGKIVRQFPAAADKNGSDFWTKARPNFFAGFQILKNGNIVVANWEGHGGGSGNTGYQLIEIDSGLTKVVSYWKQDPAIVSSLHGVLVLDSLDTKYMYSDVNGVLSIVEPPVSVSYTIRPTGTKNPSLNFSNSYNGNLIFGLDGREAAIRKRHQVFASGLYVVRKNQGTEVKCLNWRRN
ncbi:MAG TPA: hypothetical protein VHO70_09745 [Chitinispirillaceae bacterium]|nr:hypothetical protein [Chitinispirillaceae bacterium]